MRSFFKKPAWAANTGDTGSEFYRRSEQTYGDIVAANREAHKKSKITSNNLGNIGNTIAGPDGRHLKKRRLSNEAENTEAAAADTSQHAQEIETEELRKSPTSPGDHQTQQEEPASDPKDDISSTNFNRSTHSRPEDTLSTFLPDNSVSTHPLPRPLSQNVDLECSDATHEVVSRHSGAASARPAQPSAPPRDDPIVQILITSQIPNTKPLLVHRKMSQSLRDVRIEWCKRQGLAKETQSSVHLTWRSRRLFDVTTCRSLGIKLESKLTLSDLDDDPVAGPRELRIHMEAVTDDPLLLNRPSLSRDEGKGPAPPGPEDDQNEPMKLILRSPGLDDFRIKARPKTLVSKLISAFRDRQNILADQDVSLLFDGDRMDPDTYLRDHDIADLDMVEVQIKARV